MENLIWFSLFLPPPVNTVLFFMMVKFWNGCVLYLLCGTQTIDELMKKTFLEFLEFQSCTYGFTLYLPNIQIPLNKYYLKVTTAKYCRGVLILEPKWKLAATVGKTCCFFLFLGRML